MTMITIDDKLAEQLRTLAAHENRSIDDLLRQMLESYSVSYTTPESMKEARRRMAGMFDDDVTDLSTSI